MDDARSHGVLRGVSYSVQQKLMLVVLATTLVALVFTGVALVIYDLRTYEQSSVNDLMTQSEILGRATAPALAFDDVKVATENLSLLRIRPQISAAAIYTAKGALFATYTRSNLSDLKFPELPEAAGYRIEGNQLIVFNRIFDGKELLGTVYMSALYEFTERLQNYLAILGAVMALSMLVAVLMTSWMQAAMTKPILAMTEVARQVMARRDFSVRVQKTTEDEIGYLVDTFNDMLAEVGRRALALEDTNRTLEYEMAERRGAEHALRAADRRKDEFLATLAHELRNPLAPLRNALEILRTVDHDASAADAARAMMERQLRQLVHLVNDLLDVSRITTGKMTLKREQTQLHTIMQTALEATAPLIEARHQILTVLLPEAAYLYADPTRIAQVFLNLLNNAAKFTEIGGEIAITSQVKSGEIIIAVSDSGIGIRGDMLPKIFDMFAQADSALDRSHAGLGVGLTLARRLIELHGGTLSAESAGLGRGSRFIVRLPILANASGEVSPALSNESADLPTRRRILVADDNDDFVASFAMILQAMAHEVKVARDGLEALEIAAVFAPEVAFLDIGLPKINGYELARRLKAAPKTRRTLLVAVTGWGQDNDKLEAREAGFDHHLIKPVEPDQIQAILMKARAGQGASA